MVSAAIYISAHADDVCFSLGGYVADHPEGHLITVFSRSAFAPALPGLPEGREARIARVSAIRAAEDMAFARSCGLQRHELGLEEPVLRGRSPFEAPRPEDVERVRAPLLELLLSLRRLWPGTTRPRVFVPLAIGAHIDHLAILRLVLSEQTRLLESFDLAYYEDLPYASRPAARERALRYFCSRSMPRPAQRRVHPLRGRADRKLALVSMYRSQLPEPPDMRSFTPAGGPEEELHEAWWEA